VEVGFATDVTRGSSFSPLVSFASQRASGTRVKFEFGIMGENLINMYFNKLRLQFFYI
jgi:hypothetical protein